MKGQQPYPYGQPNSNINNYFQNRTSLIQNVKVNDRKSN